MKVGEQEGQRQALLWATGIWLVLFIAVVAGFKQWAMNGQPWYLWQEGFSLVSTLVILHPHALRYVVYWPMFVLGEGFDVHPDKVFTLLSVFGALGLIWALVCSDALLSERPSRWRASAYALIVVALSFSIDGRITLLMGGYSAIVWAALRLVVCDRWSLGQTAALLGGGLLCSLSSGTLAVAGALVGLFGACVVLRPQAPGPAKPFFYSLLIFFALYGGWMLVGTFINLAFYEFDPVAMLGHGIGAIALSIGPLGLGALGIAALVGLYVFWWLYRKQSPRMFVLTMAIVSASAGGLFGITTMSIGLAPLLLAVRSEFWLEVTS